MRSAEEIVARRTARLNGGVDALLATVTDRAAAASSLATTGISSIGSRNGSRNVSNIGNNDTSSFSCQNITSTSLYPDLIHAANERRKMMKVLFKD